MPEMTDPENGIYARKPLPGGRIAEIFLLTGGRARLGIGPDYDGTAARGYDHGF